MVAKTRLKILKAVNGLSYKQAVLAILGALDEILADADDECIRKILADMLESRSIKMKELI